MKIHYFWVFIFSIILENQCIGQQDSLLVYFERANELKKERAFREAIILYEKAYSFNNEGQELDSINAVIFHQLGLCNFNLGNFKEAIDNWEKSIVFKLSFMPPNDIEIIKPKINVASGYMELLLIEKARVVLQETLYLTLSKSDEDYHLSRIYQKLGVVENLVGNPTIALNYLLQAFQIREKMFADDPYRLTEVAVEIFDVYRTLEQKDQMLIWAKKGLSYVEKNEIKDEYYWRDKANMHNNIGIALTELNQLIAAEKEIQRSLRINNSLENNVQFLAINYSNLIHIYKQQERFDLAFEHIEKAKSIFMAIEDYTQYLPELYVEEGAVYQSANDFSQAINSYHLALKYLVVNREIDVMADLPKMDDVILGNFKILLEALFRKAECQFDEYKVNGDVQLLNLAYNSCSRLYDFIDQKRALYTDYDANQYISEQANTYFNLGMEIQFEKYEKDPNPSILNEFISLNQQSKSALLFQALSQNVNETENKTLKQLLQREQDLANEINDREIEFWINSDQNGALKDSLFVSKTKLFQIQDSIRSETQFSNRLIRNDSLSLKDVQNNLIDSNELILEYFVGNEQIFLFETSASKMIVHKIDQIEDVRAQILEFLNLVRRNNSDVKDYTASAFHLYKLLISDHVGIDDHITKIKIIPDGIISLIPFEALIDQNTKQQDFGKLPYLVKEYSISYASSLSVLKLQNADNKIQFHDEFSGFASDFSNSSSQSLSMMNGAVEEIESIHSLFDGLLFLNEEATKENFINTASDYKIIHMSLHGFSNIENPMLSYIQFDTKDTLEFENRLYANQIYDLEIPSDLIVLSACETGLGEVVAGEGVMSLAHAFAYAGTKSIGMSLWNIPLQATSEIVNTFYINSIENNLKSEALRLAKLDYLKSLKAPELAHPFYWAPIIVYGNQSPITRSANISNWILIIGACVMLLFLIYFILLNKSSASEA